MAFIKFLEALLLVIALFFSNSHCHTWKFGECPAPAALNPFDGDKFVGKWYIIQVSSHINPCMSLDIERVENTTSFSITQMREMLSLVKLGRNKKFSYTGTLTVPNSEESADMLVKWPANILGKSTFKVLNTDYVNYALTFECQKILFASRYSFSILSRNTTLDAATIQMLRDKVEKAGGDTSSMTKVNQDTCLTNTTRLPFTDDEIGTNNFEDNALGLLDENHIRNISSTEDLINRFNWTIPFSNNS